MASKADFSPEQWQLILDIPVAVGMGVMVAGKSDLGTLKESFSITNEFLEAVTAHQGNELILSVVNAWIRDEDKPSLKSIKNSLHAASGCDDLVNSAVDKCHQVNKLLAEKCSEAESQEFRQWSMKIGEIVAMATAEGGFPGFIDERLNKEEKAALSGISKALGIEALA